MKRSLSFVILISPVLFFSSCKKDSTPPPPPTKTEYVTKSSWQFNSAKASGVDVTAQIPSCFKDNTISFATNGSGTISEGANTCSPASPSSFTWSFQNNESQINLSTPLVTGGTGDFSLILLNDVSLVLSQSLVIPPATSPVTVEITFTH